MSDKQEEVKKEHGKLDPAEVSIWQGFKHFLGTSQSTFINHQFNRSSQKCFQHCGAVFQEQKDVSEVQMKDFFDQEQTITLKKEKIEEYCLLGMKAFAKKNFDQEEKEFNSCRKDCEIQNASSSTVVSFIKNERCFKHCRNDFEKQTKDKVALVFSKFLPDLNKLIEANNRRAEEQKIQEIKKQYLNNETDKS